MLYCVGIGTPDKNPRYISWCDNEWYETTSIKLYQYTKEQTNEVIKNMRNHFQTKLFVLEVNDNVIFDTNKPKPAPKEEKQKANGFKIKIRL